MFIDSPPLKSLQHLEYEYISLSLIQTGSLQHGKQTVSNLICNIETKNNK